MLKWNSESDIAITKKGQGRKFLHLALAIIVFITFLFGIGGTATARDSVFTQKGSGPMYWSTVGYQYGRGTYCPESVYQANIDWLAANFKSYGYDMVCDDGWGRSQYVGGVATVTVPDGYRTRHDDSWTHDYAYWSNYLQARGMKLGIYWNPFWPAQAVMSDPDTLTKYKVSGTDTPVMELITPGHGYNWIDPRHPLAEQYVKGYIHHFKSMGAKYLRVDFLVNFEATFGEAEYDKALRWMSEACGNDMELSLVLPAKHNHAKAERKHGDMMRVGFDCIYGWVDLQRSFDGFITYADLNDKGNIILDGDFLNINKYANDEERKTAVSIFAMAGSPISMIDQYDTIGTHGWLYQNNEINDLNKLGFAGKPFVFLDANNPSSQCWKGQLPNGDWVVGLFNRADTAQVRSVNFAADLNMSGSGAVRDLWAHQDLGSMTSYSASIPTHGCKILKISGTTLKYSVKELEFGKMLGDAYVYVDSAASNTNGVGYMGSTGSGVEVKNIAAGSQMTVRYANGQAGAATLSLYVNSVHNQDISFPATGSWSAYADKAVSVSIPNGATIKFQRDAGDSNVNLDKITVGSGGPTPTPTPAPTPSPVSGKTEAEGAVMLGGAHTYSDAAASGGYGVGYISYAGDGVRFDNVATCSSMTIRYACASAAQLSLYINGVHNQDISFPSTGGWTGAGKYADKVVNVTIPSGATVAFKNDGSPDYAANLDYVTFGAAQIALANPGFETGTISGWTPVGSSYGVDSAEVHSGSYKCYFWNTSAYTQKLSQTKTGLTNGSYTVKAWVKGYKYGGTPSAFRMEVSGYGGSPAYTNCSISSTYNQYTSTVNVTNGQITVSFYIDSPGSTSMCIDDVEMWKN